MSDLHIVILAAGKGTRMKSQLPKVLHTVAGAPMIEYVLRLSASLSPVTTTVVLGHKAEEVGKCLAAWPFASAVLQDPQLGTAHALLQTEALLWDAKGTLLLLSGDVPLLRKATVERLLDAHRQSGSALTVLTAQLSDPSGYGRVVRDGDQLAKIVEDRDATAEERSLTEINSGIYAFDLGPLFKGLDAIGTDNAQREYYLPDLVGVYRRQGLGVAALSTDDPDEVLGINNLVELSAMSRRMRLARCHALMRDGVIILDPDSVSIGPDVTIAADSTIHPGVTLEGRTSIGAFTEIRSGVRVVDATLGEHVTINDHCLIVESTIRAGATVGPFAHIRPHSDIGENARIGNFVELKKTVFGAESKANHLAYLGDATVGSRVNVGAGTITCNYDGTRKHPTVLEDDVFIGSDSQLVAPVRVGKGAYVAAGSSITSDVPAGALGIARARQENRDGWVARMRQRIGK